MQNQGSSLTSSAQTQQEIDDRQAQLNNATKTMFQNVSKYLQSELQGFIFLFPNRLLTFSFYFEATSEDFKLLENMNNITREKYTEMTEITKNLTSFLDEMQKKCKFNFQLTSLL